MKTNLKAGCALLKDKGFKTQLERERKNGMKKNWEKMVAFCLTVFLLLGIVACSDSSAKKGETKEAETIVLGFIGPLTGDSAIWGMVGSYACQMLVKKTNEEGGILGKKVELKIYDNRGDTVETTNAARKAILNDGVVAFIGPDASSTAIALDEVCAKYGIPHVTTQGTNYKVTQNEEDGSVRPYSFRICLSDPQLGDVMAGYAYDVLGYRKVAILYEVSSEYSLGITQNFTESFEAKGGAVTITEAYNAGDVDYRAQLTKIKDFGDYDALMIPANYKEVGLTAVQARAMGIDCPFIGVDAWAMQDLFEIAGEELKGGVFPTAMDLTDEGLKDFNEWFKKEWDMDPGSVGTDAYFASDIFMLIKHVIEEKGEATPEAIREGLENAKDVQVLTSVITIDPKTHNPIRTASIMQVGDGEFIKIDEYRFE